MNPAEPSASAANSVAAEHAVRECITTELERVVRRWQQLPLDRALSASALVRELVQRLAGEVAAASGMPPQPVPDLGPAVLMDQLRVMVFDYQDAGLPPQPLAADLCHLRRSLP